MALIYQCLVFACLAVVPLVTASGIQVNRLHWRITAINGFSWANCDAETLPGKIKTLTILPDPLLIPGEITVTTILNTSVPLTAPVKIVVTAEKEIMGEWLKIPCMENVGSCTYDDFCDLLDQLIQPGQSCPEPLHTYGLPCHCPFQEGSYYLPVSMFEVPSLSIPSWFSKGNYRVKVVVSHEGQEIGCGKITFSLAGSYL
ncbi:ganglioside GM2 activator-like [Hyla sarda]|uniref:ganglioside GM2 activator-like n=1 Tax=Hyla sarda TaxID=327740 RepID=UPI0024C41B98|nr:ganglioside GM2 activator-like [Hyla sarda]